LRSTDREQGMGVKSDYNALMLKYNKAMSRVSELEAKMEELARRIEERGHVPVESKSSPEPGEVDVLEARTRSPEKVLGARSEERSDASGRGSTPAAIESESQESDELQQMGLQTASPSEQLPQAGGEPNETRRHHSRRRRRKKLNKPWWKNLVDWLQQIIPNNR